MRKSIKFQVRWVRVLREIWGSGDDGGGSMKSMLATRTLKYGHVFDTYTRKGEHRGNDRKMVRL